MEAPSQPPPTATQALQTITCCYGSTKLRVLLADTTQAPGQTKRTLSLAPARAQPQDAGYAAEGQSSAGRAEGLRDAHTTTSSRQHRAAGQWICDLEVAPRLWDNQVSSNHGATKAERAVQKAAINHPISFSNITFVREPWVLINI